MEKPWLKHYPDGAPAAFDPPRINLARFLIDTSERHPDYIAATLNETDITYGELNQKVNALARALSDLGVKAGDRAALIVPNSPTYAIAWYGAMKIGATAVNINVMSHGEELAWILNDCGAEIAITLDIFLNNLLAVIKETPVKTVLLHSVFGLEKKTDLTGIPDLYLMNDLTAGYTTDEPDPANGDSAPAVLQYTSGTTGRPKAAMLSHRNIASSVRQSDLWIPVGSEAGNGAVICILPFFHIFGLVACLNLSVYKGYRMILAPIFNVFDALPLVELIKKYRPLSLPAVPTLWAALVSHPAAEKDLFSSILVPTSGGAPLQPWIQEAFHQKTGRRILEAYGLSEAASATHFAPYPNGAPAGSIGLPLPGTEARIVDSETGVQDMEPETVGELIVRGPQVMRAYWNNPDLTRKRLKDGWLHTGDLAHMDQQGFFFLKDRKDDMILNSGFNVYPSEVETVLKKHPAVKDAAVVGMPSRIRGETIRAFIVLESPAAKTDLITHCRNHLPEYKIPKTIVFRDHLPMSPVGKPVRKTLREE